MLKAIACSAVKIVTTKENDSGIKVITGGLSGLISGGAASTLTVGTAGFKVTGGISVTGSVSSVNLLVTGAGSVDGKVQAAGLNVVDGLVVSKGGLTVWTPLGKCSLM